VDTAQKPGPLHPSLRVLILKPSSLGDVIQALPVLRLLRKHRPESKIFWWIESTLSGLLQDDPDLDGLILFDRKNSIKPAGWKRLWEDILWMRAQRFDWVIDLQSLARSGSIAWLANGKLTIGLDDHREGARCLFDIAIPRANYHQHAADWYLATLTRLGIPQTSFNWLPPRPAALQSFRAKWPQDHFQWIVVQPGGRWLNKRWPVEYYTTLVRQLAAANPEARFAITGSAEDSPLSARIAEAAPDRCMDLAGKLSLPEMIEWIRASTLMVTNDTGPMHVAAALGKPLVAIFGPTEPTRTGPYGQLDSTVRTRLDCVPCMKSHCSRRDKPLECLTSITPQRIASLAQAHLDSLKRRARAHPASPTA